MDPQLGKGRVRRRLTGSRVLCLSEGQLLLVRHEDPRTRASYWVPPGGGREDGERFEDTAVREVREETGVDVRLVRRLRVPGAVADVTYALFLATPVRHVAAAPLVDLRAERYLREAAWHRVTVDRPLGPLQPSFWGFLAPCIRRWLARRPADAIPDAFDEAEPSS
jgi:ADP-ribose pyrophosphatase YjhB (NUDIX family)